MIELGVIAVLCLLLGWQEYNNRKERKDLVNRIVARNNQELVNLELAENTKVEAPEKVEEPPDFVETNAIPDEEYADIIKSTI